jgi:hypothetical protein
MTAHRNRDYFARPIQSDRLRHDYGNSGLSGSGFTPTDRHPSDRRLDYALLIAIAVAVVCIGLGVTAWADVPFGEVR